MRKDIKKTEKYCQYCGKKLERKRFNKRLESFNVFLKRKYCNRDCMRKAYLKIGKNNQSYSNAHTTARKINELILQKSKCELCGSNINLDIHHIDGNWKNNDLKNLMCLCRSCHTKLEREKNRKVCKICSRKHKGLGYCNKHYLRFKKYGNPLYLRGKEENLNGSQRKN